MKVKRRLFTGELKEFLDEVVGPNAVPPTIEIDFGDFGKGMPQSSRDVLSNFVVRFSESSFLALVVDNLLIARGMGGVPHGGNAVAGVLHNLDKKIEEILSMNRG